MIKFTTANIIIMLCHLYDVRNHRPMRRGCGGICPPPKKKNRGKTFFSGKYHVKFGLFVNFSYLHVYFQAKMSCPQSWLSSYIYYENRTRSTRNKKKPKFYVIFARKYVFPDFFFLGGGANAPVSYAYDFGHHKDGISMIIIVAVVNLINV